LEAMRLNGSFFALAVLASTLEVAYTSRSPPQVFARVRLSYSVVMWA
jgi:hypothetical protein